MTIPRRTAPAREPLVVLALLALAAVALRFITFGNPALGYDEQFYLLVGERMLHGALPYVDIFDRKPIGIFLIYAFACLFGGDGFLAYKLVALVFVIATAFLLYRLARQRTGAAGAMLAALFYLLWLNFMEGEGGQTPIFYDLLVLGAGGLLLAAVRTPARLWRNGCVALLLIGLSLQIKYTVLFEGLFFGCAFLWLALRQGMTLSRLALFAVAMIGLALFPTVMAIGTYAAIGHADAFLFANFYSAFGQGKGTPLRQITKLLETTAIFLPFGLVAFVARPALRRDRTLLETRWLLGWLAAAILGVVIYWRFNSPHYAIPILPPLLLALAPAFDARRRLSIGLAVIAALAGQAVQLQLIAIKGGNDAMRAVAAAARPNGHCIFVYNGYPGLYAMTGSCLPSRWAFPGHVNAADENNPSALGVDPVAEVGRIMNARPDAVIDTFPAFEFGNRAARALLHRELRAHYKVVLCVPNARGKTRVVYRRKDDRWPQRLDHCGPETFRPIV